MGAQEELPPPLPVTPLAGESRDFLPRRSGLSLNADSGSHRTSGGLVDNQNPGTLQCERKLVASEFGEERTGRGDAAFEAGEEAVDVILGVVRRHCRRAYSAFAASVSLDRPI